MGFWGELVSGKGLNHSSVFERYTESTRRAIYFARLEALRRGDAAITVADLLAGLSLDEGTRAERIGSLKQNAYYLRWLAALPPLPALPAYADGDLPEVEALTGAALDACLAESRAQLDPEARRAFGYAILEADRDRNYWIDSDHLLRGLLRFPNRAHFAVLKTELNLGKARRASRLDREKFLPQENPNRKVVQYLIRKWTALLAPPAISLVCYLYILIEGIGLTATPLAR
jgi:hypothetical protein